MYISAINYAILQFDYEFALDKSTEDINLLGIGYTVNYKKAQVIYEKIDTAYFVKYVNAEKREFFSVDRNFFMVKKENRFLFDKALNKIKFALDMQFETKNGWELLVIHRQNLTKEAFELVKEPEKMTIKLIDGPFNHLEGYWEFTKLDNYNTAVELYLEYRFDSRIVELSIKPIFAKIMSSILDSFISEAFKRKGAA
jgi:hypothetical protein